MSDFPLQGIGQYPDLARHEAYLRSTYKTLPAYQRLPVTATRRRIELLSVLFLPFCQQSTFPSKVLAGSTKERHVRELTLLVVTFAPPARRQKLGHFQSL